MRPSLDAFPDGLSRLRLAARLAPLVLIGLAICGHGAERVLYGLTALALLLPMALRHTREGGVARGIVRGVSGVFGAGLCAVALLVAYWTTVLLFGETGARQGERGTIVLLLVPLLCGVCVIAAGFGVVFVRTALAGPAPPPLPPRREQVDAHDPDKYWTDVESR
ncbi:MAG: hypothetical protein ACF8XB_02975 [Planctomycetota bacterium JB042]